ncbi:MAG: chromate transporter [Bacteroidales bacterium]|nr:chromate transporter [Bacteroidales bacterium]
MAKYCELFYTFFKIGTFTVGGGYAMIPLMEREVVERHGWLTREEFLDQVALSQAMPGVFAVNMAAVVGHKLRGVGGSVASIAGNIAMPIVFILLLAVAFSHFRDNKVVEGFFLGVRPAVVALIAAPVFTLAKAAKVTWSNCWIPVAAAVLIWLLGVSPVVIVLVAGVAGFVYGKIKKH